MRKPHNNVSSKTQLKSQDKVGTNVKPNAAYKAMQTTVKLKMCLNIQFPRKRMLRYNTAPLLVLGMIEEIHADRKI